MFKITDTKLTQDKSLLLQSKVIAFVREATIYDKGYVVFMADASIEFEFDFYYTETHRLDSQYDETMQETASRILYVINCAELKKNHKELDEIISHLYNYFVGFFSANALLDNYDISDHTNEFHRKCEELGG